MSAFKNEGEGVRKMASPAWFGVLFKRAWEPRPYLTLGTGAVPAP